MTSFRVLILSIFVSWLAYRYRPSTKEAATIRGWRKQLQLHDIDPKIRVAIGLNANVDLVVSGTELLRKLGAQANGSSDHHILQSINDVQESFAHFMRSCSAAERITDSNELFQHIVQNAETIQNSKFHIGGNAALLGESIAEMVPNATVLLVGPVGKKLKSMLNPKILVPFGADKDEVHLILEYERDEKWGDITASCANRFIMSHDIANSGLEVLDIFAENLKTFQPDIAVVSGLHLMEGKSREFRLGKIKSLVNILQNSPKEFPIHLELASMADIDFVRDVVERLLPSIHSLGLNEQELLAVSRALGGPHTQENWIGAPEIARVSDMLFWLLDRYSSNNSSMLSRIHFHSLSYHIMAHVKGKWTNALTATGAAARLAGLRACDTPTFNPKGVELQLPEAFIVSLNDYELRRTPIIYNPQSPVIGWSRGNIEMHLSPVLVCRKPVRTVGLGDAISATGLLYSRYVSSAQ